MLFFLSIFFVNILQKCQEDAQVRRIEANQLYQPTNQCWSEVNDTAASHSRHSLTLTGENHNYTSDSQVTDTSACTAHTTINNQGFFHSARGRNPSPRMPALAILGHTGPRWRIRLSLHHSTYICVNAPSAPTFFPVDFSGENCTSSSSESEKTAFLRDFLSGGEALLAGLAFGAALLFAAAAGFDSVK